MAHIVSKKSPRMENKYPGINQSVGIVRMEKHPSFGIREALPESVNNDAQVSYNGQRMSISTKSFRFVSNSTNHLTKCWGIKF